MREKAYLAMQSIKSPWRKHTEPPKTDFLPTARLNVISPRLIRSFSVSLSPAHFKLHILTLQPPSIYHFVLGISKRYLKNFLLIR